MISCLNDIFSHTLLIKENVICIMRACLIMNIKSHASNLFFFLVLVTENEFYVTLQRRKKRKDWKITTSDWDPLRRPPKQNSRICASKHD